jgi:predicted DCC family thiol-disulfide oxidoreductase YuxK
VSEAGSAWEIEAFFDGECPLCVREVNLLRRIDRRGRIRWTDITGVGFDPAAHGKDLASFMDRMQGRLPDGTWLEGVEVFRRLYGAIGWGLSPLILASRLPGLSHLLDWAYRGFARNRLRLTGRCHDGVCSLPTAAPEPVEAP